MLSNVLHYHDALLGNCKWCGQKTRLRYVQPFYGYHLPPQFYPFCGLDCYRSYYS